MARKPRKISEHGLYHVILRGVNKQRIFECSDDYEYFVRILRRMCGLADEDSDSIVVSPQSESLSADLKRHCFLYAWCLMDNHIHLLVKECDEPIGDVMKRISSSYVYYYNHKYERIGHLFQERFKSQTVDNWDYFLTLLRYIHQNPVKACIISDLRKYRWSSWNDYLGLIDAPITSVEQVLKRITLQSLSELVASPLPVEKEFGLLDVDLTSSEVDEKTWMIIAKLAGTTNATQFQALPRPLQKHYLYQLHKEGVGLRMLSRLTGVSYAIVQRAANASKEYETQQQFEEKMLMLS